MRTFDAKPDTLPIHSVANLRAWVRFPCLPDTRAKIFDLRTDDFHRVRAVDLSPGGVAVLMEQPAPRGTAVCLKLERGNRCFTLPARVQHLKLSSKGWLHGCVFALPLETGQMRALLGQ
jgi:hypothetical protein